MGFRIGINEDVNDGDVRPYGTFEAMGLWRLKTTRRETRTATSLATGSMFSRDNLAAEQYLKDESETYVGGLPFTAERVLGSVDKGGILTKGGFAYACGVCYV